jgi:hypothetical protein
LELWRSVRKKLVGPPIPQQAVRRIDITDASCTASAQSACQSSDLEMLPALAATVRQGASYGSGINLKLLAGLAVVGSAAGVATATVSGADAARGKGALDPSDFKPFKVRTWHSVAAHCRDQSRVLGGAN